MLVRIKKSFYKFSYKPFRTKRFPVKKISTKKLGLRFLYNKFCEFFMTKNNQIFLTDATYSGAH